MIYCYRCLTLTVTRLVGVTLQVRSSVCGLIRVQISIAARRIPHADSSRCPSCDWWKRTHTEVREPVSPKRKLLMFSRFLSLHVASQHGWQSVHALPPSSFFFHVCHHAKTHALVYQLSRDRSINHLTSKTKQTTKMLIHAHETLTAN